MASSSAPRRPARDGRHGAPGGRGPRRQLRRRRPGGRRPRRRRERRRPLALAPDGRIVVGGYRQNPRPATDGIVARLTPQGAIDPTYGAAFGWSLLDFSPDDRVHDVGVQSDGRIVAAGSTPGRRVRRPPPEPRRHARPDLRRGERGLPRPRHRRRQRATARSPYSPTTASSRSGPWRLGPDGLRHRHRRRAADPRRCVRHSSAAGDAGWSRMSFPPEPGRRRSISRAAIALAPDGKIVVAGAT